MAPRRPTAFDVSFPDEAASTSGSEGQPVASGSSPSSTSGKLNNLKRKSDVDGQGESRVRYFSHWFIYRMKFVRLLYDSGCEITTAASWYVCTAVKQTEIRN